MKKVTLLAAAAMLVGAGTASAQDWAGWYAGGNVASNSGESVQDATVGGEWSAESQALRDFVNAHYDGDLEPEGWSYGVQGGYNWQTEGGFVIGAELGYSVYDADDSTGDRVGVPPAFPSVSYTVSNATEIESAWNARTNLGYDFGGVLGYVVLGYTLADISSEISITSNGNYLKAASESDSVGGFTWGLGGAMRLGGPWSARLEYTHTDFDDLDYETVYRPGSAFVTPAYTESYTQDFSLDAIQVGLNFDF
jgi:outer membrane immunogenic protein